jgi:hypothetical protein
MNEVDAPRRGNLPSQQPWRRFFQKHFSIDRYRKDTMKMTRHDLKLPVLCAASMILFLAGGHYALHYSADFIPVYTGARCLLHGCNPYNTSQLEQQYYQSGGRAGEYTAWIYEVPIYPPSAFLALLPLALLRFRAAQLLWFLMNGCLFVTSSLLILSVCPRHRRWIATILVSLILVAGEPSLALGNPAIFAISLFAIGVYLFLRNRFLPLGSFLLTLSLAAKPQISALIVLALLLRRHQRRYAVAILAGALGILMSAGLILKMHPASADWVTDLHTNISTSLEPGHANDFRPTNQQATNFVNLQTAASVFLTEAWEYNAVAYSVFLVLLVVWINAAVRTKAGPEVTYLLLAALAVLSLIPVYHRCTDTGLLLVTVPAVAIVYRQRRLLGVSIGTLTVLTVYTFQFWVQRALVHLGLLQSVLHNKFLFVLLLRQQDLGLPVLFCLYMFAIYSIQFSSAPAMSDTSLVRRTE